MLLGATKYLSETKNFNGVILIFQPAEKVCRAKAMIEDGLLENILLMRYMAYIICLV